MTAKPYEKFDFKSACAADEIAVNLRKWVHKASSIFAQSWSEVCECETGLEFATVRTRSFESIMADVPESNVGCIVHFDEDRMASIWHVSEPDILSVVFEMLRRSSEDELPERSLSGIEYDLSNVFFESLVSSLSDAWPNTDSLKCEIIEFTTTPSRVKLFRASDMVAEKSFHVRLPRGPATINWISRKKPFEELMGQVIDRRATTASDLDPEQTVQQLPVEVVGVLGEVNVSMKKLTSLKAGDLLKLKQRIDRPIVAKINGRPFYECWPGRVGLTQGLEISNCL